MRTCGSCGGENPENAKFCLHCGAALEETAAPARMERKYATALFADLVGSTTLAEQQDPEIVQSVVGRTFDRLSAEIERYGGHLEKFMGDAVLAVFGIPKSHEDDPERAVRAALEMLAVLSELNRGFADRGQATARDAHRHRGGRGARRPRARHRFTRPHAHRRRGERRRPPAVRRRARAHRGRAERVRRREGRDPAHRAGAARPEGQGRAGARMERAVGARETPRGAPRPGSAVDS